MAKTETNAAGGEDQSMEEILQSIRRIIAEEEDSGAKSAATPTALQEEVLELTDMVTDEGAVVNVADMHLEPPVSVGEVEFEPIVMEPPVVEPQKPSGDILKDIDEVIGSGAKSVDSLLSENAAQATVEAFKHLKRPHPNLLLEKLSFRNGDTVEDLVLEALKPLLKAWLDDNLPRMVERIVEREIIKLT